MKVRVYFCNEPDIQSGILRNNKISRQALDTVYNLVWDVHVSYVDIPTHQIVKARIVDAVQIQSI